MCVKLIWTWFFLKGEKKLKKEKKEQNHKFLKKYPRSNGEVAKFSENDLLYFINLPITI